MIRALAPEKIKWRIKTAAQSPRKPLKSRAAEVLSPVQFRLCTVGACARFSNRAKQASTMESVYEDAAEVSEVELTPQDQLRLQWQQQPGAIPLLRQKNVIDQNAELLPFAAVAGLPGWISPGMFALQGLVLIAFIAAGLNWQMTRHSGKLEDEITACRQAQRLRSSVRKKLFPPRRRRSEEFPVRRTRVLNCIFPQRRSAASRRLRR